MSAFIVGDYHINYLLNWINKNVTYVRMGEGDLRTDDTDILSEIGNILLEENFKSVIHRYPHDKCEFTGFEFEFIRDEPTALQVLKACDCLEYQSCETEDYYDSLAYDALDSIRRAAWHKLPGYEDAEWEVRQTAGV